MASWHSCNVLQAGAGLRHIWQFDARSAKFPLLREQTVRPGDPLAPHIVRKSWAALWQPKLNVAWLPPENVFIRAAQFPLASPEETKAMVELQLEKLSPIPVTQAVWSFHVLPHANPNLQTIVVVIAERQGIEELLGKLEGEGFLADRLELPMLDQLQAVNVTDDGAWIYPEAQGGKGTALVAWWYGGVLQNIAFLTVPAGATRSESLRDQLLQMAWGGELEGWLTAPPRWHVVADPVTGAEWQAALREGLEQPVEILDPLPPAELAARTARRAAQSDPASNLLPPEFAARYRQQFIDRLWLRGLGAVLGLYVAGLIVYFIALGVFNFRTNALEQAVAGQGGAYTNALQLRAQYAILSQRQQLKYAALDCWEAVAEYLPPNVTLDSLNFSEGNRMTLNGTATDAQVVLDFGDKLRKAVSSQDNKPLFDTARSEPPLSQVIPGTSMVRWSYSLDLRRGEGL